MAKWGAGIALLALVAAACADPDEAVPGTPSRPTGADEVVVQVLVAGGFVPVSVALTTVPVVTVLGDGTVVTPAPVIAIYPGPAIVPLQQVRVAGAEVDRLVRLADERGLLREGLDFGTPPVADAPDTTVTIVADGVTYRHTAYALDLAGEGGRGLPGVSPVQAANRAALAGFVEALQGLPPGERAWVPSAVAVHDLGPAERHADPDLPQPSRPWPLATPPATGEGYPCTVVEGADARRLLDALAEANELTPWVVDSGLRALAFRPVVPGVAACPG